MRALPLILCVWLSVTTMSHGDDGPAREQSFTAPVQWSVVRNENIAWTKTLPETGQSNVALSEDRLFFTTMAEVDQDSALGQDIVAWCCDSQTGETLWTRVIKARHPLRLSGCFSDSSAPPPVTDGQHVCFFNASGRITCFDLEGTELWSLDAMPVGRTMPFMVDGNVVFIRQHYMPDATGNFTHEHEHEPVERWTQLQALEMSTGKIQWTTTCGVNMGCIPLPQTLSDGRNLIVVGRGGGHAPPEKPEGISMVDATNGKTLWTLPLPGFMSTMTMNIDGDQVLVFHDDQHLWIDAHTGKVSRSVSFLSDVAVRRYDNGKWETVAEQLPPPKNKRAIIQQSNLLVGDHHYFRSYSRPYLGRVNVVTGKVEYLQLPVQLKRVAGNDNDQLLWGPEQMNSDVVAELLKSFRKPPEQLPIEKWCFVPNEMRNSRGHIVMGDARSQGTGWGHHASQIPTAIGNHLYVPIMNGTVYVLNASAPEWDENAILAINDLGPVGQSFNRAGLTFADGRVFAHTIRHLICIGP
ncbi:outer membrane protein assembly factor BamB family protein [Stieleria varia]|uniref:Outer membrane protein assembly factor BamB n=1 Tax=Stieleria varia TaxID=2528005 RepID=A0A5C6B2W6_9BACT|nr:PQQ-binding-like beta-propeller repeat protein [Stieleria varia]TWU06463.1 Outer membrane protein assembly factor BamB [Stieleria varia]